ncbi:MAG: type IV pilus inner membrane component PilO [Planctomycetota bacterium]|jgi:Tfp pilus assembly protein PilO
MMLFRERRQIVICAVAGAMVGGFVLFRYLPLRKRIKTVEQTKAAQRDAVTKALAEQGQLPILKEQLRKLKTTVGDYEARVPGHGDLGPFLHRIANLMNEHNLREQRVQPGKEVEAEGLNCIPVSMQCKGGLKQIFEFFYSLQALERLVRIERVKLENDKDFSGELSMRTDTVVYYRPRAGQG